MEDTSVLRIRRPVYARLKKLRERLLREGMPSLKRVDDSRAELTISGVIDMALATAEEFLDRRKKSRTR